MKITKAVIPVAGKGTRFLPATKEIPKEMIPILDRPMIHYAVEEAVKSGIEEVLFVTSSGKESIENYFDRNFDLESFLSNVGKDKELETIKDVSSMIEVASVRQKKQLGLGHAVLCAKSFVGNDHFAVILADDLVLSDVPVTKQLLEISTAHNNSAVIGVMEIPNEDTQKYGIVDGPWVDKDKTTLQMKRMVEKPRPEDAPTNLATPGRYIFGPEIFSYLKNIAPGHGGEYQLTDAINMMASEQNVYAHIFKGDRHDTGNVPSFLEATIAFALADPRYGETMKEIIARKYGELF